MHLGNLPKRTAPTGFLNKHNLGYMKVNKFWYALFFVMSLGACDRENAHTIFLNRQYLTLLPNSTNVLTFTDGLGDTLYFFRTNLDTNFSALPMSSGNYERFVEGRNAVFNDSTARYRAEFGLFLKAAGSELYDVTHQLQHHFFDGQNTTALDLLFELNPPQLNAGTFYPQIIWGPDTLQEVFSTGQPGTGVPFLLFNEEQGFVGFQNVDNQQFYRI